MVVNRVSTWSSMVVILRRPRKLANTLMVQTITKVKSLFLVVAKKSVKSTSLIAIGGHLFDTPYNRLGGRISSPSVWLGYREVPPHSVFGGYRKLAHRFSWLEI